MNHIENTNIYKAEDGNFIIRTADHFIMGEDICLGSADNIENYSEEPFSKESWLEFYKKYCMGENEAKERWNKRYPNDKWEN